MAIIQSETRAGIRQAIGDHLGCSTIGTASSASDTVTFKDTINLFGVDSAGLLGGDDDYIGKWILVTDATDGTTVNIRRITDYTASSTTLSFATAMSFTPASSDTYELWDAEFNPERVNRIINDCISEVSDRILVPDEDTSFAVAYAVVLAAKDAVLSYKAHFKVCAARFPPGDIKSCLNTVQIACVIAIFIVLQLMYLYLVGYQETYSQFFFFYELHCLWQLLVLYTNFCI